MGIMIYNSLLKVKQKLKDVIFECVKFPKVYKETSCYHILNSFETIEFILTHRCCVSRYGDGEFDVIRGASPHFQKYDSRLAEKLRQVFVTPIPHLLVCIPYTIINVANRKKEAKRFWKYSTLRNLSFFRTILRKDVVYGDSLITRFYIDYEDKSHCAMQIEMLKKIWENQHLIIVEGEQTRSGIGNDLFNNALSIQRILCPSVNAFSKYDNILESVIKNATKDQLILLSLGMTASVLAYDLCQLGYWVIDIGHLDVEYEWFRTGVSIKTAIKGKYVNEAAPVGGTIVTTCDDEFYKKQILDRI